jgi:hypothetical protein
MTRRPLRTPCLAAPALALFLLAACATTPQAPPVAQLDGSYSGTISIMGETLFASMDVTQEGSALELRLSLPDIALASTGEGVAGQEGFRAEVPYTLTCPGTAVFDGTLQEDGRTVSGSVEATDCDGTMSGTFRFTRRN